MTKTRYQVGDKFSKWKIIEIIGERKALCRCACGTISPVFKSHLGAGTSTGCRKCRSVDKYTKHGMHATSTYKTWANMKNRCLNQEYREWRLYGGRGITVCDKWLTFEGFFEDMGHRPDGLTLDRIDTNAGYEKNNCRWATAKTQANNTRRNRLIEHEGKQLPAAELARVLNINFHTLRTRLSRGQLLDAPVRVWRKREKV